MSLPDVVKKLKGIQVREGLTDAKMAKLLGCSRQTYQATRAGDNPPGNKILKGVSTAFPELQKDVLVFLSNDDKMLSNTAQNPLKQPSGAQGRGLKRFFVRLLGKLAKSLKFNQGGVK